MLPVLLQIFFAVLTSGIGLARLTGRKGDRVAIAVLGWSVYFTCLIALLFDLY